MIRRKIVRDPRLLELTATHRECNKPLRFLGTMHRTENVGWHVDVECPECWPGEEFGYWVPTFQPLIDTILEDVDVEAIPWTELTGG